MNTELWGKWYTTWWDKTPHFKKNLMQQNIIVLMTQTACETVLTTCFKIINELQTLIYQDCRSQGGWLKCRRKCYLFLLLSGVFKSLPEVHKCHSTKDFLILFHPVKIFRYKWSKDGTLSPVLWAALWLEIQTHCSAISLSKCLYVVYEAEKLQ